MCKKYIYVTSPYYTIDLLLYNCILLTKRTNLWLKLISNHLYNIICNRQTKMQIKWLLIVNNRVNYKIFKVVYGQKKCHNIALKKEINKSQILYNKPKKLWSKIMPGPYSLFNTFILLLLFFYCLFYNVICKFLIKL